MIIRHDTTKMPSAGSSFRLTKAALRRLDHRGFRACVRNIEQVRLFRRQPLSRASQARLPKHNDAKVTRNFQRDSRRPAQDEKAPKQPPGPNTQLATTLQQSDSSDLISEIRIPSDPDGILPPDHPALSILGNSSLVIQRQVEMMNLLLNFEQANRYIIMDGNGQTVGYIAEEDHGIGKAMARQMFRTHRSFTTHIFDRQEREILRIHRPFAYINSRIRIYDPVPDGGYDAMEASTALQGTSASSAINTHAIAQVSPLKLDEMRIIGECQQRWSLLRRKYDLHTFRSGRVEPSSAPRLESGVKSNTEVTALTEAKIPEETIEASMVQFARIDEPLLSWDFTVREQYDRVIGSVNRNFGGFAREIFTDTGVYALRMDSAAQQSALESADGKELERYDVPSLTLDQRAVMIATAVSVDFDYFSRHSHVGGGGFMPIFWPMGGGAAEGGAAGAGAGAAGGTATGEAGAVGAVSGVGAIESAGGAVGAAGRGAAGAGAMESGIAGAGTMAGYEAMQRGAGNRGGHDDASPQSNEPFPGASPDSPGQGDQPPSDDVWGESHDPWAGDGQTPEPPSSDGGSGGGWLDAISDFFGDS